MQIIKTIWTAIILSLLISCVPGTNEIPIGTNALSEIRETAADMLIETPAEDFYLSDNGDGTLAVIGYKGEGTTVVIPAYVDGIPITKLSDTCFHDSQMTSVKIPETVTEIGWGVFQNCKQLTSVILPDTLKTLGHSAFEGCTALEEIHLPPIREIPLYAFIGAGVKRVTLSEGTEIIGYAAFNGAALESIVLPSTMKQIDGAAFGLCQNLTSVVLNDGLEMIDTYAFGGTALTELVIPASVISMSENALPDYFMGSGYAKYPLTLHFLGDAPENFYDMDSAGSGDWCTIVYDKGANGFTSPYWYGYRCYTDGDRAGVPTENGFAYEKNASGSITVFQYLGSEQNVKVPDTIAGLPVTEIGMRAFANTEITSVILPDSVIKIGEGAFNHSALRSIDLPDTLTSIGNYAFAYSALEHIILPDTLTELGTHALHYTALTELTVPGSIRKIPDSLIGYDQELTSLTIGEGITEIGSFAFGCTSLTSVVMPQSMRIIGEDAFASCAELEKVILPQGIETIAEDAFDAHVSLEYFSHEEVRQRFMASDDFALIGQTALAFFEAYRTGDEAAAMALLDTPDNPCMGLSFPLPSEDDTKTPGLVLAGNGEINLINCFTDQDGNVVRVAIDLGVTNDPRPEYTMGTSWLAMTLVLQESTDDTGALERRWCITQFGLSA